MRQTILVLCLVASACASTTTAVFSETTAQENAAPAESSVSDTTNVERCLQLVDVEMRVARASISFGERHVVRLELEAERALVVNATPSEQSKGALCSQLARRESEADRELAELSLRYGPAYPSMREGVASRDALRARSQPWCGLSPD